MNAVSRSFLAASIVWALLGMVLGLAMAISQDHGAMPAHAHIMVLGWLSFAVFAVVYQVFPAAAESRFAKLHLWLALASSVVMLGAVYLIYSGYPELEPFAAAGSIAYAASFALFALAAWPAITRPA
jgi:cbb3-type cytochrome oxidase subunit 1